MKDHILYAEDDVGLREAIMDSLQDELGDLNLTFLTASNRQEALAAIEQNAETLAMVLTDMRMPHRDDGNHVAAKAIERGIPVAILSGTIDDVRNEIKTSALGIFSKASVEPSQISDLIRS